MMVERGEDPQVSFLALQREEEEKEHTCVCVSVYVCVKLALYPGPTSLVPRPR